MLKTPWNTTLLKNFEPRHVRRVVLLYWHLENIRKKRVLTVQAPARSVFIKSDTHPLAAFRWTRPCCPSETSSRSEKELYFHHQHGSLSLPSLQNNLELHGPYSYHSNLNFAGLHRTRANFRWVSVWHHLKGRWFKLGRRQRYQEQTLQRE